MIPEEIFEVGAMLGLGYKDTRDLVADTSLSDEPDKLEVTHSPIDTYKFPDGVYYGTISIRDF